MLNFSVKVWAALVHLYLLITCMILFLHVLDNTYLVLFTFKNFAFEYMKVAHP